MRKLIIIMLVMIASFAGDAQLTVKLGATRTDLKDNAVTVGLRYLRSYDSLFGGKRFLLHAKKSFFSITPEADIRTGTEDAFSSITVKAAGTLTTFRTTTVSGLITPDFNRTFHIFPMSVGIETSNLFSTINAIGEIGWVPYYQSYGRNSPDWIKRTNVGFFMQAGYKFGVNNAIDSAKGGAVDESLEDPDKAILRFRGSGSINTGEILRINGLKVGLVGTGDVWADVVNGAIYHKLEGEARVFLTEDQYLSFVWSYGSGAPLFNRSQEIGVGITVTF